jgi:hypothetical protein
MALGTISFVSAVSGLRNPLSFFVLINHITGHGTLDTF